MSTPTTHAPSSTGRWRERPASDNQRSYLRDLADRKDIVPEAAELVKQLADRPDLPSGSASDMIDKLRSRSDKGRVATPSGRVAHTGTPTPATRVRSGNRWQSNSIPPDMYAVDRDDVDGYDDLLAEFEGELLFVKVYEDSGTTYVHKLVPEPDTVRSFKEFELTPKQRRELQGVIRHDPRQYAKRFNDYIDAKTV